MMTEERVGEEIVKLEQVRMQLFAQLSQTEGALAAMKVVLDPPAEVEAEIIEAPTLTVVEEE